MGRSEPLTRAKEELVSVLRDLEPERWTRYRHRKVIHDSIWGTCEFEPWEACLLEHGAFQRLRGLKQTGFAYLTYPTAEHSRFQHTLGVVEAASRIFDSILTRADHGGLTAHAKSRRHANPVLKHKKESPRSRRWRMLLRLAALVHDTGHSVFSHSSERIFSLVDPLPELMDDLTTSAGKAPGAAEVIVYLMVTSDYWMETVQHCWPTVRTGIPKPPSKSEWERIGRWVMGQETDPQLKWLADIVSGPLDADKLDYVFRDGYSAGIPVGYDLARLISTVCVDPQTDREGTDWWRLTIPIRGINALEQLVMGRLVLNSYLYHHQKCRAAEVAFERALAREYIRSESILGCSSVWGLFRLQDADAYVHAAQGKGGSAPELKKIYGRQLRVRVVEFHSPQLPSDTAEAVAGLQQLAGFRRIHDWDEYKNLISFEDQIADAAGLDPGEVMVDVPKNPDYADLTNLKLPNRRSRNRSDPAKVLAYREWIEAYKLHRTTIRIFGPRGPDGRERNLWKAACEVLDGEMGIQLPPTARVLH